MEEYRANKRTKVTEYAQEPETGLYYFYARWYDPQVGRFITWDPIVCGKCKHSLLSGSDAKALHPYSFAANNPIVQIDPTGLKYGPQICAIFCGIYAVALGSMLGGCMSGCWGTDNFWECVRDCFKDYPLPAPEYIACTICHNCACWYGFPRPQPKTVTFNF